VSHPLHRHQILQPFITTRPRLCAVPDTVCKAIHHDARRDLISLHTSRTLVTVPQQQVRDKKSASSHRFLLTLFFPKSIPSLAAMHIMQRTRLITGRTGKMATKKAAKKVAKKAAKKK
jgi:hypothetical protein